MTDNDTTVSTPPEEELALSRPIIGGLPAVEGSAWDIGAPLEDRGADLAGEQGSPPDQAGHEDTRSS